MMSGLFHASSASSKGFGVSIGALVLAWATVAYSQGFPSQALVDAHRTVAALELEQLHWPSQNSAPKPYLREYLSEEALLQRVEDPLRMSAALEALYDDPVTPEQLQAEMEREAVSTKQPDRLRELWGLLGNDPYLIAEVIARPILAENRLRAHYYADEKIHGSLRAQALEELSWLGDSNRLQTLSGSYNELEYRLVPEGEKNDVDWEDLDQGIQRRNPEQWETLLASLGESFGRENFTEPLSLVGTVSGLKEDTEHFYAQAIVKADSERIRIGTISWAKTPFGVWWERSRDGFAADGMALNTVGRGVYSLSEISPRGFTDGEGWQAISTTGAPTGRIRFVWQLVSSSRIIAWGGQNGSGTLLNSGGLYDLTTNSWQATSTGTNCPAAQTVDHWAWTGTQLIIWNGFTRAGARYNLASNTWSTMTSTDSPGSRHDYSIVWSGTYAIEWGGINSIGDPVNTGGRYNPTTDTWTATGMAGSLPTIRAFHTATWDIGTGFMHVWGGMNGPNCLSNGGLYTGGDTWYAMSTSGAPSARINHSQVPFYLNGFLVWGGQLCDTTFLNTGGWYDGDTSGVWHAITTTGAPEARLYHTAIFGYNGRQMIIWGGMTASSIPVNTGGRYIPQFNSWATLSTQDAPEARRFAKGVDIANEGLAMVVWGGDRMGAVGTPYLNSGAVYIFNEYTPTLQSSPVTATDTNSCSKGIQITWKDASNWHDSGFGTRSYQIYRNGSLLTTQSYGTTSYTDSATAAGTTYNYAVRYISGIGLYTHSGSVSASDSFGVAPSSLTNNTAADVSTCADSGVSITWAANPGNWGDNGVGTRTYDVLRNGGPIASNIPYNTLTYTDTTGTNGTTYTYTVRYNNGCGLNATTTGVSAADIVASAPSSLTNNTAADVSACADSGVSVTWTANPGNWGDNGSGTRSYSVLRNGAVLVAYIAYGTTSYTDGTGVNGTSYSYQVRYNNGCSLSATTTGASAADAIGSAPSSLTNNTAADVSACTDSGVSITWAANPGDWGDNGSGTRTYTVLRNVTVIAPSIAYGTTTYTDLGGTNGQSYTYRVQYNNGCGSSFTTDGVSAADAVDTTPCGAVGNTLTITKSGSNASLAWTAVSCGDLANYRVYGATTYGASFPSAWTLLSSPSGNAGTDPLASAYQAYAIVTVDQCGNASGN